jgi:hypothetical protein
MPLLSLSLWLAPLAASLAFDTPPGAKPAKPIAGAPPAVAAKPAAVPPPSESLHYAINWPSGLSFGEAHLRATQGKSGNWETEFTVEASVPGFPVMDKYRSEADANFCSLLLERTFQHGQKRGEEKSVFDRDKGTVSRETLGGGGTSTRDVGKCAQDAMAFLQLVRRELAQGRVPKQQDVVLGASYNVRLDYNGSATVSVGGGAPQQSDWMIVTLKGPKVDLTFDLFFAKDAARTPLQVRVPLQLGVVSVDLQR